MFFTTNTGRSHRVSFCGAGQRGGRVNAPTLAPLLRWAWGVVPAYEPAGLAATLIALTLVPINLYLFGRATRDPSPWSRQNPSEPPQKLTKLHQKKPES